MRHYLLNVVSYSCFWQVMDLTKGGTEWLSTHLSHTVKTHNQFYKLQEGVIEIAKVSKLLVATENGLISKFRGKSLQDLDIDVKKTHY